MKRSGGVGGRSCSSKDWCCELSTMTPDFILVQFGVRLMSMELEERIVQLAWSLDVYASRFEWMAFICLPIPLPRQCKSLGRT